MDGLASVAHTHIILPVLRRRNNPSRLRLRRMSAQLRFLWRISLAGFWRGPDGLRLHLGRVREGAPRRGRCAISSRAQLRARPRFGPAARDESMPIVRGGVQALVTCELYAASRVVPVGPGLIVHHAAQERRSGSAARHLEPLRALCLSVHVYACTWMRLCVCVCSCECVCLRLCVGV